MTSLWAISKTTSLTCFALGTVSQLKRSRRSNHSFSCSLSSFPFRERLTSSLSSLLRYARKDSNKRYSFTASSAKRKAVVKALPNLIGIITFDSYSGYGLPLSNLQVVPDDWNSLVFAISAQIIKRVPKCRKCIKENAASIQPVFFFFLKWFQLSLSLQPCKKNVFILVVYTCYIKLRTCWFERKI